MSSVQIFHSDPETGEETMVIVIDGDLIKKHSKTVRDMIASKKEPELVHKITLKGPEFDALKYVLEQIIEGAGRKKKVLNIHMGYRSIQASLRIHRAIKCLQLQPEQMGVPAYINKHLALELVTCHEMLAVHAAYASINNPHGKLYHTMINTIAWRFVNDPEMQIGRKKQLSQASATQPDLFAAISDKVNEFQEKKRVRLIIAEKRAARDEKRRLAEGKEEL
jgi:vacuolar-type H+-ATPase subunit F/Vma7